MPLLSEHSARLRDPGDFDHIAQLWEKESQGIRGLGGPLKSAPEGAAVEQAIRFDRTKWTVAEAKKWLADHDYKPLEFEAAEGATERAGVDEMCVVRSYAVNPAGWDEATRSVESVMGTAEPCRVLDRARMAPVDDVLIMAGGELPPQIPLLDTHDRTTVKKVLGSTRNLRVDGEGRLIGRSFFSATADGQDAATKVKEGHIRDNSFSYLVLEAEVIPPRQTRTVAGRAYTAKDVLLRIVKRWKARENSVCAVGLDPAAQFMV